MAALRLPGISDAGAVAPFDPSLHATGDIFTEISCTSLELIGIELNVSSSTGIKSRCVKMM